MKLSKRINVTRSVNNSDVSELLEGAGGMTRYAIQQTFGGQLNRLIRGFEDSDALKVNKIAGVYNSGRTKVYSGKNWSFKEVVANGNKARAIQYLRELGYKIGSPKLSDGGWLVDVVLNLDSKSYLTLDLITINKDLKQESDNLSLVEEATPLLIFKNADVFAGNLANIKIIAKATGGVMAISCDEGDYQIYLIGEDGKTTKLDKLDIGQLLRMNVKTAHDKRRLTTITNSYKGE